MSVLRLLALLISAAVTVASLFGAEPSAPAAADPTASIPTLNRKVDFEAEVLPFLKRNCLACHNQTDAEADLVLETPKAILKGGEDGPVVVPHEPLKSDLLKSAAQLMKPLMPPKNNKVGAERLKPDELALLKTWIEQGATGTVNAKPRPLVWRPLPPGLHPILAVAITNDEQYAACGRANQIFIYHVPTGQIVTRLTDPKLTDKPNRSGYQTAAQRDFVQSLAFSPDGNVLASGEYRMVKLWQREPHLAQFTLANEPASAIATSPDGKWIATASQDNIIRLWDATTGKAAVELPGHTATVTGLAFSPDSIKLASVSTDKTLRVWEVATAKLTSQLETPQELRAVSWLLGGKQLATAGGDEVIRLWQMSVKPEAPLTPLKELRGHTKPVTCLSVSADGKQLLSGSLDGSARHWAVEQARQVHQMDHGAPVVAVAVSPNGKTFASAGANYGRLWSADKGQPLGDMKGDPVALRKAGEAERAAMLTKNEVAYRKTALDTVTKEQKAKAEALKKATAAMPAADREVAEKKDALTKVTDDKARPAAEAALKKASTAKTAADKVLKETQAAAKQSEQAVTAANAASDKALTMQQKADSEVSATKKALATHESPIRAIAFAPNGLTVATAGDDQMVRTWSAENGSGFETYPGQLGPVQSLAYTSDGRLASQAKDHGVVVWRTTPTWTLARSIGTGDAKSSLVNRILALDFTSDGKLLATGGGTPSRSGEVKIWRVADAALVREIKPSHSDTVFGLAFSPDGSALATASADKFVKVFDPSSGKLLKSLSGHTHYVLGVSWRADGHGLASCGADKTVKLWDYPGGEQTKSIEDFKKEVTNVRFVGLGGEMLTASGEARIRLLKEDGSNAKDFSGAKGFIFTTAITQDGQTILGGGQDSVLRVWNASGKSLFKLDPPAANDGVETAEKR